jgi:tryptophan 2,3-dioxygenase
MAAAYFRIGRDHLEASNAVLSSQLAAVKALAKVQNDHADAVIREQQAKDEETRAKLDSALKAGALTAAALSDSVRRYIASRDPRPVPADPNSTARADEAVKRADLDSAVAEGVNGVIRAGLECHATLTALQEWAGGLAH